MTGLHTCAYYVVVSIGAHLQVAGEHVPEPFKVNMNRVAKTLVPTKVKTLTPASNGNLIVQDVLRAAGCNLSLFLTSKQGPTFRRTVW